MGCGSVKLAPAVQLSVTLDENGIDKNTSNYDEERKFGIHHVSLLKHKINGFLVVRKKFKMEALKDIKERCDLLTILSEITKLRHRHTVDYLWKDRNSESIFVFLEYCSGGSLKEHIESREKDANPFTEEEMLRCLRHMARGLSFIHSKKIIHRKVKPSNVLFDADNVAKIADFGEGTILISETALRNASEDSEVYMAPEMMRHGSYSFSVDIWALGIILHEMATYKVPYAKVVDIPHQSNFEFVPLNETYSDELRQLAKKLLTVNAADRPQSDEITEKAQNLVTARLPESD